MADIAQVLTEIKLMKKQKKLLEAMTLLSKSEDKEKPHKSVVEILRHVPVDLRTQFLDYFNQYMTFLNKNTNERIYLDETEKLNHVASMVKKKLGLDKYLSPEDVPPGHMILTSLDGGQTQTKLTRDEFNEHIKRGAMRYNQSVDYLEENSDKIESILKFLHHNEGYITKIFYSLGCHNNNLPECDEIDRIMDKIKELVNGLSSGEINVTKGRGVISSVINQVILFILKMTNRFIDRDFGEDMYYYYKDLLRTNFFGRYNMDNPDDYFKSQYLLDSRKNIASVYKNAFDRIPKP